MEYLNFLEKKILLLNGKGTDDSTENMSGITDDHQNYENCECKVKIVIGAWKKNQKVKNKAEDFSNLQSVTEN